MGERYTAYGTGQPEPEDVVTIPFFVEAPPGPDGVAIDLGEHHLKLLKEPDLCAPECLLYGACNRNAIVDCDAPGAATARHLIHQPGRCQCRGDDGNWERKDRGSI